MTSLGAEAAKVLAASRSASSSSSSPSSSSPSSLSSSSSSAASAAAAAAAAAFEPAPALFLLGAAESIRWFRFRSSSLISAMPSSPRANPET